MDIKSLKELSIEINSKMPWLAGIRSEQQYHELIELMDELVTDYDANKTLIDLLFPVIERYEDKSALFQKFNDHIDSLDKGRAMLSVIIDQYGLKLSDLPEIGGKSLVSLILKGERKLTVSHIQALSRRFDIPKYMFI
ncbi:transcriptional regulator [Vibrio sp. 947]|uniref:helix-turn-helix domain-containing protein n=1 Tax=Vibrio TaxID=662 RepID=UPI001CDBA303|nr:MULTISPECIES: transcriptional regulator [Vibrio]MCA2418853.1 transcriptional regulator [Vibrio alginolyticus]MCA2443479.1 transcriptional regulator [Vibrio alginolyticus]MDW1926725.1 transcriptional regulator [Vibrio sp. 947]MDW1948090.1 transcriptional regulator [Vibrio sp. 812(2023)]MDW1990895.1 transcriptional regulator [Vibrio sp. 780]